MEKIRVGLAGFGVVGSGVYDILLKNRERFRDLYGVDLEVEAILVKDLSRKRLVETPSHLLTTDPQVLQSSDILVELIGGDSLARTLVLGALERGQFVVTANKALLASHWTTICRTLKKSSGTLHFEAAVAGAIPVIKVIEESLAGNRITEIKGIINGTTNYILSQMEETQQEFSVVLEEAQRLGFAESDPTFDIDGIDIAHKISILVVLAYGVFSSWKDIHVEGIRSITKDDIFYAKELGYRIKMLAIAKKHNDVIEVRVHPVLLKKTHSLADVHGANNAINIRGSFSGDILLCGQGAGSYPTASAVVGDILDVVIRRKDTSFSKTFFRTSTQCSLLSMDSVVTRYFLRFMVDNCLGVLAQITNIFAKYSIGIDSIIQKESSSNKVSLVIMTAFSRELDVQKALVLILNFQTVDNKNWILLRIED